VCGAALIPHGGPSLAGCHSTAVAGPETRMAIEFAPLGSCARLESDAPLAVPGTAAEGSEYNEIAGAVGLGEPSLRLPLAVHDHAASVCQCFPAARASEAPGPCQRTAGAVQWAVHSLSEAVVTTSFAY
jgi:hypothetical protein